MSENQSRTHKVASLIGYFLWFALLVRIVFLSTGNPLTNPGEVLGSHLGLAFWLLILSAIPYFMVRARAKKNLSQFSWLHVMFGVTVIALLLAIGGFYGRSKEQSTPPPVTGPAPAPLQSVVAAPSSVIPSKSTSSFPATFEQCREMYVSRPSAVGNLELLNDYCRITTDAALHPIKRTRALCVLQEWSDLGKDPKGALMVCEAKHPSPPCPNGMEFDLENMRCEISCDMLKGYAPDETGKACYLACPNGGFPIYSGRVLGCNL